jgi:hypothetical protein
MNSPANCRGIGGRLSGKRSGLQPFRADLKPSTSICCRRRRQGYKVTNRRVLIGTLHGRPMRREPCDLSRRRSGQNPVGRIWGISRYYYLKIGRSGDLTFTGIKTRVPHKMSSRDILSNRHVRLGSEASPLDIFACLHSHTPDNCSERAHDACRYLHT